VIPDQRCIDGRLARASIDKEARAGAEQEDQLERAGRLVAPGMQGGGSVLEEQGAGSQRAAGSLDGTPGWSGDLEAEEDGLT
jgi:hypothetical protein